MVVVFGWCERGAADGCVEASVGCEVQAGGVEAAAHAFVDESGLVESVDPLDAGEWLVEDDGGDDVLAGDDAGIP